PNQRFPIRKETLKSLGQGRIKKAVAWLRVPQLKTKHCFASGVLVNLGGETTPGKGPSGGLSDPERVGRTPGGEGEGKRCCVESGAQREVETESHARLKCGDCQGPGRSEGDARCDRNESSGIASVQKRKHLTSQFAFDFAWSDGRRELVECHCRASRVDEVEVVDETSYQRNMSGGLQRSPIGSIQWWGTERGGRLRNGRQGLPKVRH